MVLLLNRDEVLEVIDRKDPNVLWQWYARAQWFPAPSLSGRPSMWTYSKVLTWIEDGIDEMFQEDSGVSELADAQTAIVYKKACRDRLEALAARLAQEEQAEAEKAARLASIVKVFRKVPVAV